jgi:hypothetical protein
MLCTLRVKFLLEIVHFSQSSGKSPDSTWRQHTPQLFSLTPELRSYSKAACLYSHLYNSPLSYAILCCAVL